VTNLFLSGAVNFAGGARTINVASSAVTATITGAISGGTGLTKTGNGVLILNNASINYTGATTVLGGLLQLGSTAVLPTNTAVVIGPGATFDVAGRPVTAGSLGFPTSANNATGGMLTNSGGAATFTVGGDNTNTTFAGMITNAGAAGNSCLGGNDGMLSYRHIVRYLDKVINLTSFTDFGKI